MNGKSFRLLKEPVNVSDANAKDYKGKWLAILEEKIVADNEDIGKLIDATRACFKNKKVEFVRISKGDTAMY